MSTSTITNVLVLGASGPTGQPIVNSLRRNGQFKVSIAVRPDSKYEPNNSDITVHKVDYNSSASIDAAFKGQDAVVSAISTFAVPVQQIIIDAAVRAGVKRFIPSEYGVDAALPVAAEMIPATKMKRDTVAYLRTKQDQGAGKLSWTALCVGGYFDWAIRSGFWGYDFKNHKAQVCGDDSVPFEATNVSRIGDAVAKILEHPEETANQYVYVHSFRTTQAQVLKAMEEASKTPWQTEQVDLKELYEHGMRTSSTTELNLGVAEAIRAVLMGYKAELKLNDFGDRAKEWMKKLGLVDENLSEVCRGIVAAEEGGQ